PFSPTPVVIRRHRTQHLLPAAHPGPDPAVDESQGGQAGYCQHSSLSDRRGGKIVELGGGKDSTFVGSGSSIGPTRNRISRIVVPGAPARRACNSAGLRNAASSSRSVGCATVTFKTPRRTSPTRV